YVLLAFLQSGLVHAGGLTQQQLLDAIAIGQATPGPVFTTATLAGYLLAGVPGGLAATAGIFLPAFILVPLSAALLPRLHAAPAARRFLDGVNVGAVALLVGVAIELGRAGLHGPASIALTVLALLLLMRGVSAACLMLGGALLGIAWAVGCRHSPSDEFHHPQHHSVVPSHAGVTVLVPKLATTLKDYPRHQFANDLVAGLIVGVVALPLA